MPTATTGTASVLVTAPAEEVYRLVADVTAIGDRSPECYRTEWLEGATEATPGARFKGWNKLGPLRWTTVCRVTVADPGREFTFHVVSPDGREQTRWSYLVEPAEGGVRVTESYEFLWCPLAARIAELPFPRDAQLRRGMQRTLAALKAAAEGTRSVTKPRTAPRG